MFNTTINISEPDEGLDGETYVSVQSYCSLKWVSFPHSVGSVMVSYLLVQVLVIVTRFLTIALSATVTSDLPPNL